MAVKIIYKAWSQWPYVFFFQWDHVWVKKNKDGRSSCDWARKQGKCGAVLPKSPEYRTCRYWTVPSRTCYCRGNKTITITRIPGPCLVAAWSQGGLLETPPRWHVTIHTQPSNHMPASYDIYFENLSIRGHCSSYLLFYSRLKVLFNLGQYLQFFKVLDSGGL